MSLLANPKVTAIIAVIVMFIGTSVMIMVFYNQIQTALDGIEQALDNQEKGQVLANVRGNASRELTIQAINEIKELQENITATDDDRGQKFVKYLEAESDDTDEELDDLRNITLALTEYHNITVPGDVSRDSIKFEDGTITFENGTIVRLGDIFGTQ